MGNFHSGLNTPYRFRWYGPENIPARFDLRASGWLQEHDIEPSSDCIGVMDAGHLEDACWRRLLSVREEIRRFVMVIGTSDAAQRATIMQVGFGEAMPDDIDPREFEARACNLAQLTRWVPRQRTLGDLTLDLLAREAYGYGKSLNLNPREFALLWRLADNPGETVSKRDLIQDVWRMGFVPETNSIAVHMSRLRRKLGFGGMDGIIATSASGGYCLNPPGSHAHASPAFIPELSTTFPGLRRTA